MLVMGRFQGGAHGKRAHLEGHEVEGLLRDELAATVRRRVVRHLLAGCPVCQATARTLWEFGDERFRQVPQIRRKEEG